MTSSRRWPRGPSCYRHRRRGRSDLEAAKAKRAARSPAIGLSQGQTTSAHVSPGTPYSSALSSLVHSPVRDREPTPTPEDPPQPDKPVLIPAFFIDAASTKNWRALARNLKRLDPGQTSLARGDKYRVQAPRYLASGRSSVTCSTQERNFTISSSEGGSA